MRTGAIGLALLAMFMTGSSEAETGASNHWWPMSKLPYAIQGSGDVWATEGARVSLRSAGEVGDGFGGASQSLDARPLRGKRITLSATLDVKDATKGAAILLRAALSDGGHALSSSQRDPVLQANGPQRRDVSLVVPMQATRLMYGVGLAGAGAVEASELRLAVSAAPVFTSTPDQVLDAAIELIKTHALNASLIDWPAMEPQLRLAIKDEQDPAAAHRPIRRLLKRLDDNHSFLVEPAQASQTANSGRAATEPVVKRLEGDIGYILMPGYLGTGSADADAFVRSLASAIDELAAEVHAGWVVDLRLNGGGNMQPMLAALKPLLGSEPLGSFEDVHGQRSPWRVEQRFDALASRRDMTAAKVAVLIGPRTSSSGEIVALSFRGRPATRSFGQPSDGRVTGNRSFSLPDGSQIHLASSRERDRQGNLVEKHVEPDILVASEEGRDSTLQIASEWLKGAE